jgi:hypothetical protein
MDEIDFTLDGEKFHLTRQGVIHAMRNQIPGGIQKYAVDIEGARFPVKQVLAQALRIPTTRFITTRAQDILRKLGFRIVDLELDPADLGSDRVPSTRSIECLRLAVALAGGKPNATSAEVLKIADDFAAWLAA